jgi:hypothetical protein
MNVGAASGRHGGDRGRRVRTDEIAADHEGIGRPACLVLGIGETQPEIGAVGERSPTWIGPSC